MRPFQSAAGSQHNTDSGTRDNVAPNTPLPRETVAESGDNEHPAEPSSGSEEADVGSIDSRDLNSVNPTAQESVLSGVEVVSEGNAVETMEATSEGGSEVCSICLSVIEPLSTDATDTPCEHKFHKTCLDRWRLMSSRDNHQSCPTCRAPLTNIRPVGAQGASMTVTEARVGDQNQFSRRGVTDFIRPPNRMIGAQSTVQAVVFNPVVNITSGAGLIISAGSLGGTLGGALGAVGIGCCLLPCTGVNQEN